MKGGLEINKTTGKPITYYQPYRSEENKRWQEHEDEVKKDIRKTYHDKISKYKFNSNKKYGVLLNDNYILNFSKFHMSQCGLILKNPSLGSCVLEKDIQLLSSKTGNWETWCYHQSEDKLGLFIKMEQSRNLGKIGDVYEMDSSGFFPSQKATLKINQSAGKRKLKTKSKK